MTFGTALWNWVVRKNVAPYREALHGTAQCADKEEQ
jgi:hypothetical protein